MNATFTRLNRIVCSRPRARANGGFQLFRNTRLVIYQAQWPHHSEPVETYAIKLHRTEIIYHCADAMASFSHSWDGSVTTKRRMRNYQSSRLFYEAGELKLGHRALATLPSNPTPYGLKYTYVVETPASGGTFVWTPKGRRLRLVGSRDVEDLLRKLLQSLVEHIEPLSILPHPNHVERMKALGPDFYSACDDKRLGAAIALALKGKHQKALGRLVWRRDRRGLVEGLGIPDKIVQLIGGMGAAENILARDLYDGAKVSLGILHFLDESTGERLHAELGKPNPEWSLIEHAHADAQPAALRRKVEIEMPADGDVAIVNPAVDFTKVFA